MRKAVMVVVGVLVLCGAGFWLYDWFGNSRGSEGVSVKKEQADSLEVEIDFGVGNLLVEGGAKEWVDGTVDSDNEKLYPVVSYKNKRNVGHVELTQKKKRFSFFGPFGNKRNNWDLQLTDDVPVDLEIETGVAESELRLQGVRLRHLSVDAGVGSTVIDLTGDRQENVDAEIDLGVGGAKIYLPKETGVQLKVSKGVGSVKADGFISKGNGVYVNEAHGRSDTSIDMEVDVGVGDVTFILTE